MLCIGMGEFVKACIEDHQLRTSNLEASSDIGEFALLSSTQVTGNDLLVQKYSGNGHNARPHRENPESFKGYFCNWSHVMKINKRH